MNDLANNQVVRIAVVTVLVILALFLLVLTINGVENLGRPTMPITNTITVSGMGKAIATPDIGDITFSVTETATSVADAQTQATKKTNAALDAVKNLGVADTDVSTVSYDVSPQYAYPSPQPCPPGSLCPQYIVNGGTPKITGYEVSETIEVKVRDTSKVGDVLQALGTLGVQNISGPNFIVENSESVNDEARTKAIADARSRAETLASELGVRLGQIVSYSENNGDYPGPIYAAYDKSAGATNVSAPPPTLPIGQNETTINVSVTYEIR